MTQQVIGTGTQPNDATGDPARTAFTKANANFTELYGGISPAGTIAATQYVATTGSDLNSGQNWANAKATLQAAINALPINGGIVEIGYGTFTDPNGFTIIDSNLGANAIHIRGRGMGRSISGGNASVGGQLTEVHPTVIASTIIIRASPELQGGQATPESKFGPPFLLEDCAIIVPSSTGWNAVGMLLGSPFCNFRRVAFDSNGAHGVMSAPVLKFTATPSGTSGTLSAPWAFGTNSNYFLVFSDGTVKTNATLTNNSTSVTWTGAISSNPTIYAIAYQAGTLDSIAWFLNFEKCRFVHNNGCAYMGMAQVTGFYDCHIENNSGNGSDNPSTPFTGVGSHAACLDFTTIGTSQEVSFYNCVIQRQTSGCGGIYYTGTALQLSSCHIENNKNASFGEITVNASVVTAAGCYFVPGPSTSGFGISSLGTTTKVRVVGCTVAGGANWIFGFTNTVAGVAASGATWGNRYTTTLFGAMDGLIQDTGNVIGGNLAGQINVGAPGNGIVTNHTIIGPYQQVLSANGAVTVNAALSGNQIVLLAANASATTITNPSMGQILTLSYEQDNTGSRTYVWPTNCRFNANTQPVASTAANTRDTVTFQDFWTGTNHYWLEIARAIGVPSPLT